MPHLLHAAAVAVGEQGNVHMNRGTSWGEKFLGPTVFPFEDHQFFDPSDVSGGVPSKSMGRKNRKRPPGPREVKAKEEGVWAIGPDGTGEREPLGRFPKYRERHKNRPRNERCLLQCSEGEAGLWQLQKIIHSLWIRSPGYYLV
ncbi:hypothetical protein HJG60_010790 [Phyllostomus discolor]|uniref:Uncharacterized protein n=1 Tax=Phyllostomus discolor TaxID=89673 RepID=A0A834ADV3_9CHIR|nr:hypothetical protein HJG60_010790 [Phyllostomus discolor]